MLLDVTEGHPAYIQRKIFLWSLEFRSWLRPRAVSRLRSRFARDKIIKSLRWALRAELRTELLLTDFQKLVSIFRKVAQSHFGESMGTNF